MGVSAKPRPHAATHSREIELASDDLIITKTDPKGAITYANRTFMRIAGYSEYELLGHPHNIIRHPDMPRGVYRLLWKTIATGQEFFGVVKNYTAEGHYYWVLANITPDYDSQGVLKGYYSVRRKATKEAIQLMSTLYATMRQVETQSGKQAGPDASIAWLQAEITRRGYSNHEKFVIDINQGVLYRP